MNNIQSKMIIVNGLDVHYYTAGQGEPLVVIHGGGGDARTWRRNIGVLAEKYTVYAPDLPGYGGSQPLDGKYYVPELSDFVEKFTKSLGLEKFSLVGHSLGGGIALDYALKFPLKITKLVLISSLCLGREIAFWVRFFSLPAFVRSIGAVMNFGFKCVKLLLDHLNPAKYILPLTPAGMAVGVSISNFHQQTLVLEKQLPEVKMPTLLVWGSRDPVVPVKQAYRAAEVIPDCQVAVFRNSGHNVHREELKKFSSIVTDFLG
ncbi:MAG: alpha/beta fold hydrolase [Dehalococcoidales bacterium]|nr:alpha/beta fold hydrolase [Dehalococcoidales bacterium]